MKTTQKHGSQPGFMLAPMIDMTFLLLIFFMLTSKITKEQIKMDVKLPIAASAVKPEDLANRDIINIDAAGEYFLGDKQTSKEQLAKHLHARFKVQPPLRLYIRADKDTPAKKIKELMKVAAEAGAVDVIFGSYKTEQ